MQTTVFCHVLKSLLPLPCVVLLGDGGEAQVGDAGLAPFTHPDFQAAVSNCGPFAWTVRRYCEEAGGLGSVWSHGQCSLLGSDWDQVVLPAPVGRDADMAPGPCHSRQ